MGHVDFVRSPPAIQDNYIAKETGTEQYDNDAIWLEIPKCPRVRTDDGSTEIYPLPRLVKVASEVRFLSARGVAGCFRLFSMSGKSSLRAQAQATSGVPYSAVELARSSNLYERIGAEKLAAMSNAFYERVYGDEPWFRSIFANTTRAAATRNQVEFLAQEFGGPPLYERRKGATMLIGRHAPYAVDPQAAERWLKHMEASIEEVGIEGEEKGILLQYFKHMAWYVVYGRELLNPTRTVGYYGKHTEGDV